MTEQWQIWSKQYVFFAPRQWTFGPIAIIFEAKPIKKGDLQPHYKAWALLRGEGGRRVPASMADISGIVGRGVLSSFYGFDDHGCIAPLRFLVWLLGGEWDCGFWDDLLFQLDWFLFAAPATPEYLARMQTRMNGIYGTFYPTEQVEPKAAMD